MTDRVAKIIGSGAYLPERVLSNHDLEKMVDTSDEWIFTRTGMKERRIARDDEYSSCMGIEAAKKALADAGKSIDEIDVILVATLSPDYIFPSTANLIQRGLGAGQIPAFDFQAACTGYLYGFSLAKSYIRSGMYNNVLLIATEKLSSFVNYQDRKTCVLFGDGAAAVVISSEGSGYEIRQLCLGADGDQADLMGLPAGGCRRPASHETVDNDEHYIFMNGREVFRHAVRRMESAAQTCLDEAGMHEKEIHWFVPHQANERIIDACAKRFGVAPEKVYKTVHKYGNTSASSIAIALDELIRCKKVRDGDNLLLVAFGAGLTWGASILTKVTANE